MAPCARPESSQRRDYTPSITTLIDWQKITPTPVYLADRISEVPGIVLDPPEVETNLVFFNVEQTGPSAKEVSDRLLEKGIRIGIEGEFRMRLVTHLDVDREDIEEAAEVLTDIITHP